MMWVQIGMIWVVWYVQTFLCLIVLLNFIIAVIGATYNRVAPQQQAISYKNKADLNQEYFELMANFGFYASEVKLLMFSVNKEKNEMDGTDEIEVVQSDIKKHISK